MPPTDNDDGRLPTIEMVNRTIVEMLPLGLISLSTGNTTARAGDWRQLDAGAVLPALIHIKSL
jgi:hypothetical protein